MTIAEIRGIEESRKEPETCNVIHFLKEGDFLRAHDWSAWLIATFPFGEAANKSLKFIAKKLKDGYIDVFWGFPASSIGKYVPNDGSVEFNPVSENQYDVRIEIPAEIGEMSFDNLNQLKEEWKNSLPLQEGKKQKRENRETQEQAPRFMRMSDIVGQLISLPMEDLSPREAYNILRDLRKEAMALY